MDDINSPQVINDIIQGIVYMSKLSRETREEKRRPLLKEECMKTIKVKLDGYEFKAYGLCVFERIRSKILGISVDNFLESWKIPKAGRLKESAGRSGSLFFKTCDNKYFFKTIHHPEVEAMRNILFDYYNYLSTEKSTFIMKVVGLYRLEGKSKVWVLVFKNSLPHDLTMNITLDLKGRKPKPGKSYEERGRMSDGPIKDNELKRGLMFENEADKEFFARQVRRDSNFLRDHNLMDYSLLVGVHILKQKNKSKSSSKELSSDEEKKSKKKSKKRSDKNSKKNPSLDSLLDAGGMLGRNPQKPKDREVYFFGIIDCLTEYVLNKKIANTFKKGLWDLSTLSTVDSSYYAFRFKKFLTSNLLNQEVTYDNLEVSDWKASLKNAETTDEDQVESHKYNTFSGKDGKSKKASRKRLEKKAISDAESL